MLVMTWLVMRDSYTVRLSRMLHGLSSMGGKPCLLCGYMLLLGRPSCWLPRTTEAAPSASACAASALLLPCATATSSTCCAGAMAATIALRMHWPGASAALLALLAAKGRPVWVEHDSTRRIKAYVMALWPDRVQKSLAGRALCTQHSDKQAALRCIREAYMFMQVFQGT